MESNKKSTALPLWRQILQCAEQENYEGLKALIGIVGQMNSVDNDDQNKDISLQKRAQILCGSIRSKATRTLITYSTKTAAFLEWHRKAYGMDTDCLVTTGKVIQFITELDEKNLSRIKEDQQGQQEKSKLDFNDTESFMQRFFDMNGNFQIPFITLEDLPFIEHLLTEGVFDKYQHMMVEDHLHAQLNKQDRRLKNSEFPTAVSSRIHSFSTKTLQGYLSSFQWLAEMQSMLLGSVNGKLLDDSLVSALKGTWKKNETLVMSETFQDKHRVGNTLYDRFSVEDIEKLQDVYLQSPLSSSSLRFRAMLLAQWGCAGRGDDIRSILLSDLLLYTHGGSKHDGNGMVCLYVNRQQGE